MFVLVEHSGGYTLGGRRARGPVFKTTCSGSDQKYLRREEKAVVFWELKFNAGDMENEKV